VDDSEAAGVVLSTGVAVGHSWQPKRYVTVRATGGAACVLLATTLARRRVLVQAFRR
jgi:hypothetical protein